MHAYAQHELNAAFAHDGSTSSRSARRACGMNTEPMMRIVILYMMHHDGTGCTLKNISIIYYR